MANIALRPSGAVTCSWVLAIIVIRDIDCHERRLKSVVGNVILLEYIYNLAEEPIEINIETILLVSAA